MIKNTYNYNIAIAFELQLVNILNIIRMGKINF